MFARRGARALSAILKQAKAQFDAGRIEEGFRNLVARLHVLRQTVSSLQFRCLVSDVCLTHPVMRYLHQDPYVRRSFESARGSSGDATLLDFVYGLCEPELTDSVFGKALFAQGMARPSCQSARDRRALFARQIDECCETHSSPLLLAVGCGHLRELESTSRFPHQPGASLIAIDEDPANLAVVAASRRARSLRVEPLLCSTRSIAEGRYALLGVAFAWVPTLYESLSTELAIPLTARLFRMLGRAGKLLIANSAPGSDEQGYREAILDEHLVYRDEEQLQALAGALPREQLKSQRTFRDAARNIVYLELTRS